MNKQLEASGHIKKQFYEVTNQLNQSQSSLEAMKMDYSRLSNDLANSKELINKYETEKIQSALEYNTQLNVAKNESDSLKNKVKQITAELSHKVINYINLDK